MIKKLAQWYEKSSWTRFIIAIPIIGSAINAYLLAVARESSATLSSYRKLFGFKHELIYIVCSQLDESELRQQPEPEEFLYLSKYGDIDAFFEVLTSLGKVFPRLNAKFCTGQEFGKFNENQYATNLLLIGGPDYNEITRFFMQYTPFEFITRRGQALLNDKKNNRVFKSAYCKEQGLRKVTDYGFFLKMPNPLNHNKTLIMINGIHTYGVYGAAKCFLSQDEHEINLTMRNCKDIIDRLGKAPNFAVILEVQSINNIVAIPSINPEYVMQL